jgi:hypothetical protein
VRNDLEPCREPRCRGDLAETRGRLHRSVLTLAGRISRTGHLTVSVPPCRATSRRLGTLRLRVKSVCHLCVLARAHRVMQPSSRGVRTVVVPRSAPRIRASSTSTPPPLRRTTAVAPQTTAGAGADTGALAGRGSGRTDASR